MSTELGGRKRRKKKNRKNRHHLRKRKFCPKKDGQEYGQVLRMLGYLRALVYCSDDKERVCHIRGRLRSKEYIRTGDFVLVELRDYQNYEGDIILKYTPTEVRLLKKRNKLPVPPETDDRPLLLYGQIVNMLSKRRVLAFCIDGQQRVCRVLNKERMERGDIILVACRDHLGGESNVIYKCAPDEAQRLKDVNELPGYIKVNNGALLEYGRVTQVLRNCRVLVQCFDGEQRICRIRRKRKRAVIPRIRPGHIVLVKLRDREDCEGIVLLKYKPDEAQQLVENLGKLGIKAGNSEERQTSSNMTSDDNKEEMKGEKGGGEEAGVGAGNEPKTQSENSEEEQIGNVMPFGGNSESEEKSGETAAVGSGNEHIIRYGNNEEEQASNIVPSGGNSEYEEKNGGTTLVGTDSAKKKQSTTSVDSSMEDKCLLEKKSAMNILLECDEEKAEASTPESSTATTSKKISSLNEDIMEYLLENQVLKHELLLKKCRLVDLQIEYFTRQLRRGFQE